MRKVETTIPCADGKAHGKQDLVDAFANSCNSAFSHIGAGLKLTSFKNLCTSFYLIRIYRSHLNIIKFICTE